MKVLVIGAGGREHAICWKLRQSPLVQEVFCAPGSPGTDGVARRVPLAVDKLDELCEFARAQAIDLTVVGPEYPLSLGIVDLFRRAGLCIFGPSREAARIESSKQFAKELMLEAGVATAAHEVFTDQATLEAYLQRGNVPVVLKADGLAAGKGVFVCPDQDEALSAARALFAEFGARTVIAEEFLEGVEASYIVATDGERIVPFAASHDYKRIYDKDQGPNTGGMGTVSPTPNLSAEQEQRALKEVIAPVLATMRARGEPYVGFLYAGLMVSPKGDLKVLEFNARLGDPETQVILPRMEGDLFALLRALSEGPGKGTLPPIMWTPRSAVCVVLAASGYPGKVEVGDPITGIELAEQLNGVRVFHAGTTRREDGVVVTAGGRVLGVTALGESLVDAREAAYRGCDLIQFKGRQLRRDIGAPR